MNQLAQDADGVTSGDGMRKVAVLALYVGILGVMQTAMPAAAQVSFALPEVTKSNDNDMLWMTCSAWDRRTDTKYISGIYPHRRDEGRGGSDGGWRDYIASKTSTPEADLLTGCADHSNIKDAQWRLGVYRDTTSRQSDESHWKPSFGTANGAGAQGVEHSRTAETKPLSADPKMEREKAWQAQVSEYEAAKAKQQAQVAAYEQAKLDVERKKAEQRQAAEKAAEEFRQLTAAHQRALDEQARQVAAERAEYERQRSEWAKGLPKARYENIAVKGNSGATRAEAEQNFLAEMNAKYPGRSNMQYQCVDIMGRWVCNGSVEFGSKPARQSRRDEQPSRASSQ